MVITVRFSSDRLVWAEWNMRASPTTTSPGFDGHVDLAGVVSETGVVGVVDAVDLAGVGLAISWRTWR